MFLNVIAIIIFIFLNVIVVIIIIIIIAIYRSQFIYILLIIIVKYQYFKTALVGLAIDRIHVYIIRNISFNRKIYFHIYSLIICRSFFDVH